MIPKIRMPDVVPTRGTDEMVERGAGLEEMTAHARSREHAYERLKLHMDNLIQDGFAPYLPGAEISDAELEHLIHEAGWWFVRDHFGTPEEWQMWTNRFRRIIAIVSATPKGD